MKILSYRTERNTDKAVLATLTLATGTEVQVWLPLSQSHFCDSSDDLCVLSPWLLEKLEAEHGTFAEVEMDETEKEELTQYITFKKSSSQQNEMLQIWGEKYGAR